MTTRTDWTEEQEALVRKLWYAGLSANEISAQVGHPRSSVFTKVHGMGLPKRWNPRRPDLAVDPDPTTYPTELERRCCSCRAIFKTRKVDHIACDEHRWRPGLTDTPTNATMPHGESESETRAGPADALQR